MAIIRPAYLEFINDYLAYIVFPDGNKSQLLASKNQVFEVAEALLDIGLTHEEVLAIKEQASKSKMVRNSKTLEDLANNASNFEYGEEGLVDTLMEYIEEDEDEDLEGEEWKSQ